MKNMYLFEGFVKKISTFLKNYPVFLQGEHKNHLFLVQK